MPLTPAVSAQYNDKNNGVKVSGSEWGGGLCVAYGKLTYTGAGQGQAKISILEPGRKLILPDLSRMISPAGAAGQTLSVGLGAYTKPDGTAVAASINALANAVVNTGALDQALPLPAGAVLIVDSTGQVDVTIDVATANSAAAGDVEILIVYAKLR